MNSMKKGTVIVITGTSILYFNNIDELPDELQGVAHDMVVVDEYQDDLDSMKIYPPDTYCYYEDEEEEEEVVGLVVSPTRKHVRRHTVRYLFRSRATYVN